MSLVLKLAPNDTLELVSWKYDMYGVKLIANGLELLVGDVDSIFLT